MPNTIEATTGLVNINFVGSTSRYLKSPIINYVIDDTKFLTFKTFKRPTRTATDQDKFYVITKGTEYRPDIVSKRAYGKEGYWWVIMMANEMKDITEFVAGKSIIIPTPHIG